MPFKPSRYPAEATAALADDVARLRRVLEVQDGPVIVAGHPYGGQIMTALGTDAPDAERLLASRMDATTVEVAASHVAMVSHPDEVVQLITSVRHRP